MIYRVLHYKHIVKMELCGFLFESGFSIFQNPNDSEQSQGPR